MPGISLLVIVIGLVALAVYLATGFMQGRQNRKPLERDSITESTAKALYLNSSGISRIYRVVICT